MPVTQPTIIDRLEREWDEDVRRGIADQALARWRRHSPALNFASVDDLVGALAGRRLDTVTRSQILCALLELAPRDQIAARLVLQRFLPYLATLVADRDPFDIEEWVGLLVAIAYEAICDQRVQDGPAHVAAKLSREIRHRALAALSDRRRTERELAAEPRALDEIQDVDDDDPFGTVDLREFLVWAVRDRVVDRRDVALAVRTRLAGMTVAALATAGRECADTLRQRRRRAERCLAVAIAGMA